MTDTTPDAPRPWKLVKHDEYDASYIDILIPYPSPSGRYPDAWRVLCSLNSIFETAEDHAELLRSAPETLAENQRLKASNESLREVLKECLEIVSLRLCADPNRGEGPLYKIIVKAQKTLAETVEG